MDKSHTCKICNKRFKGGKAMGGHMRSHLAKFPLPPKQPPPPPPPPQHSSPEFSSSSTTSTTLNNSNNNNNNIFRIRNINSTVMQMMMPSLQRRQVSSFVSDVFSPEDCAISLMMLSRDKWNFKKQVVIRDEVDDDVNDESFDDVEEEEEEEEEEEDHVIFRQRTTPTTTSRTANGKYKCETCKKVFKSYQALGGHRASHKRIRQHQVLDDKEDVHGRDDSEAEEEEVVPVFNNVATTTGGGSGEGYNHNLPVVVEHPPPRTFECPFCFKLFDSGQALGGHKKVHYYNNNNSAASTSYYNLNNHTFPAANSANINAHANRAFSSANFGDNNNLEIDLNLPALEDGL